MREIVSVVDGKPERRARWSRDRDRSHWNQFYRSAPAAILEPSSFARATLGRTRPGSLLFEMGCGNGRDALFFAQHGVRVIACDLSEVAIAALAETAHTRDLPHPPAFLCADFTDLGDEHAKDLDFVYSRFTLHAVPRGLASRAMRWSHAHLKRGGRLLIEARSVEGSLYGRGRPVERDAFVHDGHYRRFLRLPELCAELGQIGFRVEERIESDGLAVLGDDDPVVIRVVAVRD